MKGSSKKKVLTLEVENNVTVEQEEVKPTTTTGQDENMNSEPI